MTTDEGIAEGIAMEETQALRVSRPLVGICVVNYWSSEQVASLLASVPFELGCLRLCIVDNSEEMQSLKRIRNSSKYAPDILVVSAGGNIGYGAGNNLAAEELVRAWGVDVLWILNPDTVVKWIDLEEIDQRILADDEAILWATLCEEYGRGMRPGISRLHLPSGRLDRTWTKTKKILEFPHGNSLMVSVKWWVKLGGMDSRYFLYFEEPDLVVRSIGVAGSSCNPIGCLDGSAIQHVGGVTIGTSGLVPSQIQLRESTVSALQFYSTYYPRYLASVMVVRFYDLLSLIRHRQWKLAWSLFSGIGAGLFKSVSEWLR